MRKRGERPAPPRVLPRPPQLIAAMVMLAHMLGCFWFYIASVQGIDPDIPTWCAERRPTGRDQHA